ncbi:MAG: class I SAM-dependent methyltransferase [Candidatus Bathyarchaeota archaeon]|nr:class I SAM-dependent methyltransferase [Candidatus Bathyarchaeota archaeon]
MTEWNRILQEKRYSQEEPDKLVVNFAAFLKANKKVGRVLDFGCGAGRHLIYMAKQGFEAHGMDISETGLNATKRKIKNQNLEANIVKCHMNFLPYINSCFDAVICLHIIYHQKLEGMQKTISEIHRILKKKGFLLVNFLSKRTYRYGKGEKVEEDTFIDPEGVERGVLHHFTDEEEIRHLLKDFHIIKIRLLEREVEGKLSSRWILTATV